MGAKARVRSGPIMLALEDHQSVQRQISFAAELAASMGVELIIMSPRAEPEFINQLNVHAEPLRTRGLNVRILATAGNQLQDIAHIVHRLGASLLMTPSNGPLSATAHRLGRLTATLGTPLLLFRIPQLMASWPASFSAYAF